MCRGMLLLLVTVIASSQSAEGDPWRFEESGSKSSLRGICSVNIECCWASGASGTVVRTTDGGATWLNVGPKDTEAADFRDIHAWDESRAIVMSAGDVDRLYLTKDGGQTWQIVFEEKDATAFFDGMAFDKTGTRAWLMGDPLDGRAYFLRSVDSGVTWERVPKETSPSLTPGLAAFAASGTHLLLCRNGDLLVGLGGQPETPSESPPSAFVLRTSDNGTTWSMGSVPITSNVSSGIFSLTEADSSSDRIVAVGGDYKRADFTERNIAISEDHGLSWRLPKHSRPSGFRSAVVRLLDSSENNILISCGPSGTDRSMDSGETWTRISDEGFHSLSVAFDGTLRASGAEGRIAKFSP